MENGSKNIQKESANIKEKDASVAIRLSSLSGIPNHKVLELPTAKNYRGLKKRKHELVLQNIPAGITRKTLLH